MSGGDYFVDGYWYGGYWVDGYWYEESPDPEIVCLNVSIKTDSVTGNMVSDTQSIIINNDTVLSTMGSDTQSLHVTSDTATGNIKRCN
jgi:hypothetical protein